MPAEEAARLFAELEERHRLSREAALALTYPAQSVNYDGYRQLVDTDAAACTESDRARIALHIVYPCADEVLAQTRFGPVAGVSSGYPLTRPFVDSHEPAPLVCEELRKMPGLLGPKYGGSNRATDIAPGSEQEGCEECGEKNR